MNYETENSMVLPYADDEPMDRPEIDEDTQFEERREEAIEDRERFARSVTDDLVGSLPDIMMLRDQA